MSQKEQFSNRWGIILAALGMAVGAGNLWRFPRLAGQYGGTFIVLWMLFLLIWSVPVLLAEFAVGKKFKKGVIGAFADFGGKKMTWAGFFIALCTLGITFYYSVVTAWALRYLGFSIQDLFAPLLGIPDLSEQIAGQPDFLQSRWNSLSSNDPWTVLLHILAVAAGLALLYKGIRNGLEKANKILIPSLFILLIITGIAAVSQGGIKGLEYMFTIRPELFGDPKVWIEALSQSAWSTGAGWGLMLTISSYSSAKEDVTLNTFISGFGNNTASLIAGMAVLPAVFAMAASEAQAVAVLESGNQALMFTVIPQLFSQIGGGKIPAVIFFGAFFLAAFSSLLPMLELFIKLLTDWGLSRKTAIIRVFFVCIICGLPSALSLDFFSNQDWVWGIGLIISGLFFIVGAFRIGLPRFKAEFIDADSDFKVPNWYFFRCHGPQSFLGYLPDLLVDVPGIQPISVV